MSGLPPHEAVPGFDALGVLAFTTTREAGSFNLASSEPAAAVFARWDDLRQGMAPHASRLASAHQVHGNRVLPHQPGWEGWLRAPSADGHFSDVSGTGMAVSLADCVPVFIAHPSGTAAILHSGWRGTAARIIEAGVSAFTARGLAAAELHVHLGPAICGRCYEVGPEVLQSLTGANADAPGTVDLRALIERDTRAAGVRHVTTSPWCTRCHNERFFSHRAGDGGRQLGLIVSRGAR